MALEPPIDWSHDSQFSGPASCILVWWLRDASGICWGSSQTPAILGDHGRPNSNWLLWLAGSFRNSFACWDRQLQLHSSNQPSGTVVGTPHFQPGIYKRNKLDRIGDARRFSIAGLVFQRVFLVNKSKNPFYPPFAFNWNELAVPGLKS